MSLSSPKLCKQQLDDHDTTTLPVITVLNNQIEALHCKKQTLDEQVVPELPIDSEQIGAVAEALPPNLSTNQVTTDNVNDTGVIPIQATERMVHQSIENSRGTQFNSKNYFKYQH